MSDTDKNPEDPRKADDRPVPPQIPPLSADLKSLIEVIRAIVASEVRYELARSRHDVMTSAERLFDRIEARQSVLEARMMLDPNKLPLSDDLPERLEKIAARLRAEPQLAALLRYAPTPASEEIES